MRAYLTLPLVLALSVACTDNHYYYEVIGGGGAGGSGADGGSGGAVGTGGDAGGTGGTGGGEEPFLEGAPATNTTPAEQVIDLFGTDGNTFWFAADPAQVEIMNQKQSSGGGDIYSPGGQGNTTYVNHLFATSGSPAKTADYGKVEVRLIGESTFRPWAADSIPNLRVDMDEFTDGLEVGGAEHLRFNNGLVGSIYRELIAYEIYRGLGYPAPRASFAWAGSNVWGPDVLVPYTMTEVYKSSFCTENADLLGGGCPNMFEFVGDIPGNDFDIEQFCQIESCTGGRLEELGDLILATPPGEGFKAALADHLDWDMAHRFQCLSWILWTGDDAFHNSNNVVLLEREDGRFIYLPYSVDISAGQEWYQFTPLYGSNSVANGCQSDPTCWNDTIATCEAVIEEFQALDPVGIVDSVHARLEDQGMLRPGDQGRYEQIRAWYEMRINDLLPELDQYRGTPCTDPNVKCGPEGTCVPAWECNLDCGAELQCGPNCAPECFDCSFPFEFCNDGSCRGACP